MPNSHDKWMNRYNDSLAAAQSTINEDTAARAAKTARLREQRLAAEAAAPAKMAPPARKPAVKGKRPGKANASTGE